MKKPLWLIRHGKTKGNTEHRYVGTVDEPLCDVGIRELSELKAATAYPAPETVYVSPMIRCRQTARILFPEADQIVIPGMEECDFGDFEYKNYEEMNGYPVYQEWIDSGGKAGFPGGESMEDFSDRIGEAFERMLREVSPDDEGPVVLVCHGGSIMAILDRYSQPHKDYFEWQAPNGLGFTAELDSDAWRGGSRALTAIKLIKDGGAV